MGIAPTLTEMETALPGLQPIVRRRAVWRRKAHPYVLVAPAVL